MNNQLNQKSTSETREFITAVFSIVWKDLRIERHTRQTISVMVMFSVVTVIMFNFALESNLDAAQKCFYWVVMGYNFIGWHLGFESLHGIGAGKPDDGCDFDCAGAA